MGLHESQRQEFHVTVHAVCTYLTLCALCLNSIRSKRNSTVLYVGPGSTPYDDIGWFKAVWLHIPLAYMCVRHN